MAEFPRVHWKSIEGNDVPFTEPQHFTGDGDDVVRTGENNPLPTKDKEVLTELESIKAENEEIKQKQQEILERLDKPIDTQVTGSNVEHLTREDVELSPGAYIDDVVKTFKSNYRIGLRVKGDKVSKFDIYTSATTSRKFDYEPLSKIADNVEGYRFLTDKMETKGVFTHFRLYNRGADTITLRELSWVHID